MYIRVRLGLYTRTHLYTHGVHISTHARVHIRTCFWDARRIFLENPAKTRPHSLTDLRSRPGKILESILRVCIRMMHAHNALSLSLSLFPSVNFSLFLSIYPSIHLFFFLYFLSRTLVADRRACTRVRFPIDE